MRWRTAAVVALVSAGVGSAAPAFGYWSEPVVVEVTLRAGQLEAVDELTAERDGTDGSSVLLQWRASKASSAPVTGYLIERAIPDEHGTIDDTSWVAIATEARCDEGGGCSATDPLAPANAAYRVTAESGTWRSGPSNVALSTTPTTEGAVDPSLTPSASPSGDV